MHARFVEKRCLCGERKCYLLYCSRFSSVGDETATSIAICMTDYVQITPSYPILPVTHVLFKGADGRGLNCISQNNVTNSMQAHVVHHHGAMHHSYSMVRLVPQAMLEPFDISSEDGCFWLQSGRASIRHLADCR